MKYQRHTPTLLLNTALLSEKHGSSIEKCGQAVKSRAQPEDLLCDADTAMYRAKARGKARYEVFTTAMHDHVIRLLQLENSFLTVSG